MGQEYIREVTVLGSVPSLGPVILFDDIEGLLKWGKGGTGGDDVMEKSATIAYNGSASLHIKSRTTTATAGDIISAKRYMYERPGMRYRLECIFMWLANAATEQVLFEIKQYDGVIKRTCAVKWIASSAKWQYYNSASTWTDIPGGGQNLAPVFWHRLLLEFDSSKKEFLWLECDGLRIDMRGLAFYYADAADAASAQFLYQATAGASPPAEAYLDDVLVLEI